MKSFKKNNSGFILPLAVLITSIILSMSFTIFILVFSSIKFSALGRDSQVAFYAADGGVECALFWDIKFNAFDPTNPRGTVDCAEKEDVPVTENPAGVFSFSLTGLPNGSCAEVEIDKSEFPVTVVRSRGHNTCDAGRSDRAERALEVSYSDFRSADLTDGLVSYWPFDEGAGVTAFDSVGFNDGMLGGDGLGDDLPMWVDSMSGFGMALDFDGEDDFVDVGTSGMSTVTGSAFLWVKVKGESAVVGVDHDHIFSHRNGDNTRIYLEKEDSGTGFFVGIGNLWPIDTGADFVFGEWAHIGLTWDNGVYNAYFNGNNVKTGNYFNFNSLGPAIEFGTFLSTTDHFFNGVIDEVRVYDQALGDSKVKALYGLKP